MDLESQKELYRYVMDDCQGVSSKRLSGGIHHNFNFYGQDGFPALVADDLFEMSST